MKGQLMGAKAGTSSPGPTSLFAQRQGGSGAVGGASHHLLGPPSLRFEAETPGHLAAQGQTSGKWWGSVPQRATRAEESTPRRCLGTSRAPPQANSRSCRPQLPPPRPPKRRGSHRDAWFHSLEREHRSQTRDLLKFWR